MKTIVTKIEIEATKEQVWSQLMNWKSYASWNPFIKSIEGKAELGGQLQVSMQLTGSKKQNHFAPRITRLNENEFEWLGVMGVKGIFDGRHFFKLRVLGENKVELIHGESFTGILSGLFLGLMGKKIKVSFNEMNRGLKHLVERS